MFGTNDFPPNEWRLLVSNFRQLLLIQLLPFFLLFGCLASEGELDKIGISNDMADGLPVGFDRRGGYVIFNEDGAPVFEEVSTKYPVLHFAGHNLNKTRLAYTSLAKIELGARMNRELITLDDSLEMTLDDLVPTGELVIEKDGTDKIVSRNGEFVPFAVWSPTQPDVIAYGYNEGYRSGIVVMNVATDEMIDRVEADLIPDYFVWSDDGLNLIIQRSDTMKDADIGIFTEEVLEEDETTWFSADVYDFGTKKFVDDRETTNHAMGLRLNRTDRDFTLDVRGGGRLIASDILGGDDVIFEKDGEHKVFKAEQIRSRSRNGLVYVNAASDSLTLYALRDDGEEFPILESHLTPYYIPSPVGSTVTFTQIGESYSGGGCGVSGGVSSHIASSSMKYAIDIQISGSTWDGDLASKAGTVTGVLFSATVNCQDSSGCPIYDSSYASGTGTCRTGCTSTTVTGYGWGNYVILAHSDGFYTMETHMQAGTVTPTACGSSAVRGCQLGREGGTGRSCGSKNGCGDHQHFQKQSGSTRSSQSVAVSFSEDGSITSTDCVQKTPTTGGMSCAL